MTRARHHYAHGSRLPPERVVVGRDSSPMGLWTAAVTSFTPTATSPPRGWLLPCLLPAVPPVDKYKDVLYAIIEARPWDPLFTLRFLFPAATIAAPVECIISTG